MYKFHAMYSKVHQQSTKIKPLDRLMDTVKYIKELRYILINYIALK
jgi:hypothetical protein